MYIKFEKGLPKPGTYALIPEAELVAKAAETARLKAALGKTVGFCVNFRKSKPCWKDHPEVGVLFAVVTLALEDNDNAKATK